MKNTNHTNRRYFDPFDCPEPDEYKKCAKTIDIIDDVNLEAPKNEAWIQTFSGKKFHPFNPSPESICLEDIAHGLSMICRFNGQCKNFYSVAQHCVLVSYLCDEADAMHGLLHDASEAYICDFSSPLKHSGAFQNYKDLELTIQSAIYKDFGLSEVEPKSVKNADKRLLYTEARDLMSPLHPDWKNMLKPLPFKINPLAQEEAKDLFLSRFAELWDIDE